jgi:hypothetical protein
MNINDKIKKISILENNNSYINEQIRNSNLFLENLIPNFIILNPNFYINCIKKKFTEKKFYPLYILYNNNSIQDELKNLADNIKKNNSEIKIRFLKDIETNFYRIEINFTFIGFIIENNPNYISSFYFPKEFYINLITKSNIRKIMTNIYWDNLFFPNTQQKLENININNNIIIETKGIQTFWSLNKIIFLNELDYSLEKNDYDEILNYNDYWYNSLIKRENMYIFIIKHDFIFKKLGKNKIFNYYGHLFLLNYMSLIKLFENDINKIKYELEENILSNKIEEIFGNNLEYYGGDYNQYYELKEREWNRIKIESLKF